MVRIARRQDSKVVEAFLDLCYGRIVDRRGRLDQSGLNSLIKMLGDSGCASLGLPLLTNGINLTDNHLASLFDLADTVHDAALAVNVLVRFSFGVHPCIVAWKHRISAVFDKCPSEWQAYLVDVLVKDSETRGPPRSWTPPGERRRSEPRDCWVTLLKYLDDRFKSARAKRAANGAGSQPAMYDAQPPASERRPPRAILREMYLNKAHDPYGP